MILLAHGDPIAPPLLRLAIILVAAKLGGHLAVRLAQPAVLGELVIGVVLGNIDHTGLGQFGAFMADPFIDMLARLGVLILLFEAGLESTIAQMLRVGTSSLLVAVVGVAAPFALGWLVSANVHPSQGSYAHAFVGATLSATSVGITARVLKDLGQSQSKTARVILGAAVIDDVLGLVLLAVVGSIIAAADAGGAISYGGIAAVLATSALFLVGSLVAGAWVSPRLFSLASKLQSQGVLLAVGLAFCFALAWLADIVGLAPIVGAFAAGLIFEDVHYRDFVARGEHSLSELVQPVSSFLVPIFFVEVGLRTDLASFADPHIAVLAALLTLAAIVGKLVSGAGVVTKGVDRRSVGIGMIPRGEVGLIFANVGLGMTVGGARVISDATFSAIVVMVIVTTMVTPPALKWSLARAR